MADEALQRYVEDESWKAEKIRHAVRRADAGDIASDEEMQAGLRPLPARCGRIRMRVRYAAPGRRNLIEIQDYTARDDPAAA